MPRKRPPFGQSRPAVTPLAPISPAEIDLLSLFTKNTLGKDVPTEAAIGDVRVDFARQIVIRNNMTIELSTRETRLLRYLFAHEGEVVGRDELLREVWGFEEPPTTRSVDNYILSLRKKIEPHPSRPRHIQTVRGGGYRFTR